MAEGYVRPPIVAREPGSRRAAVWRVRLVALGLLVVLGVALFLLLRSHGAGENQNPGIGGAARVLTAVPGSALT